MNNTTNPTREQMYQWYVVEKKSFRQIMKLTGIKNNRKIPKLLKQYNIEIRRGSEEVKTQWINNESRRKRQGEWLSERQRGKPSRRRMSLSELKDRYKTYNITILKRYFVEGYTYMDCQCDVCGYLFTRNLKNSSMGCFKCGVESAHDKQRLNFEEVEETFNSDGVVLLSTEYKNSQQKLDFICPEHSSYGIQRQSYQGVKEHGACKYCRIERRRKEKEKILSPRQAMAHLLKEWRMAVFERDDFTCQCCGHDKGKILQAHHIKNFSKHEHLRLDIDNGITLCKNCHDPHVIGSFHHMFGTHDNNEQQLKEYLEMRASD